MKADSKYIIVSGSATILENLFLVLPSVISEMTAYHFHYVEQLMSSLYSIIARQESRYRKEWLDQTVWGGLDECRGNYILKSVNIF